MKTICVGLRGTLRDEALEKRIEDVVALMTEIKFHSFNVLGLYANKLAEIETLEASRLHLDVKYRESGEVFNQDIRNQAIALARAGKSNNAPELLREASEEYFQGELLGRNAKKYCYLDHPALREQLRETMRVAFKNCMEISTPLNQRSALVKIYGISPKEAKVVAAHVSTSNEQRSKSARDVFLKKKRKKAFIAEKKLEKANGDTTVGEMEELVRKFNDAKKELESALTQECFSEDVLAEEFPLFPRINCSNCDCASETNAFSRQTSSSSDKQTFCDACLPLDEIIRREKALVPDSQSQLEQLRYRWSLLKRSGDAFSLVPFAKYGRSYVRFTHLSSLKLVSETSTENCKTLKDVLPHIFREGILNSVKTKNWEFGNSFLTNGVQLQFSMVTAAKAVEKLKQNENKAKGKQELKVLYKENEDLQDFIAEIKKMPQKRKRTLNEEQHLTELKNKKSKLEADIKGKRKLSQTEMQKSNAPSSKKSKASKPVSATSAFVIPPNATLVGIDPGVRNVFGCAREDGRGWAYSSARYRHDTGETKRRRFQEKTIKKRSQQDAEFSNAFREVADARSKTTVHADLLAALQTHGKHFGTLYSLYGHRDMALIKFFNYIGSHRVLHELVKKVAPKKRTLSSSEMPIFKD